MYSGSVPLLHSHESNGQLNPSRPNCLASSANFPFTMSTPDMTTPRIAGDLLKGARVLVVARDRIIFRAVASHLDGLNLIVECAANGAEALERAASTHYDIVITERIVGGRDGSSWLQSFKGTATAFVLLTGPRDVDFAAEEKLDGALVALLPKPFDKNALESAVNQALEMGDARRVAISPATTSAKVLVVEDSESDAFVLKQALQMLGGFQVSHATRMADALKLLYQDEFDTILTDLTLPDARGLTAVMRLRESAPNATLIVCSGLSDDALALRVIELGAQDFITKGYGGAEALGRAIRFARVRRQAERRLISLARTDALTGLANRVAFDERLAQALAQARRQGTRLGVLYLDLDGFKAVNDGLGHEAGDTLLREVAGRMRGCIRDCDCVARLGGDEFVVLVGLPSEGSLETVRQRMSEAIEQPVAVQTDMLAQVGASFGMAIFPTDAQEADGLLRRADAEMYAAKRARKRSAASRAL
jgi:diguanylate cyclase (GGDEF)-like protein